MEVMSLLPPIYDCFGKRYTLLTPQQSSPHPALRAERFSSIIQARRFIGTLKTPLSYWRKVFLKSSLSSRPGVDEKQMISLIAEMLYRGRIRAYKVDGVNSNSSKNLAFTDAENTSYAIKPVNFLLLHRPPEIKTFQDQKEALEFVSKSGATDKELTALLNEHNLDTAPDSKNAAAKSLVEGDLVVTVSRYTQPPKPDDSVNPIALFIDKVAGLGPPPDDEFKEITLELADEFDGTLGGAHSALFDGVEYTLKTDTGEEHKGVLQSGKIHIPKAKMNSGFELTFKDLPAFL
jgi:hypothetical protein